MWEVGVRLVSLVTFSAGAVWDPGLDGFEPLEDPGVREANGEATFNPANSSGTGPCR